MAIYTTYSQFRAGFAVSATIGLDGFKVWPSANMLTGGDLTAPSTISAFPFSVHVATMPDPTAGVDRYDWYVSQRTDITTRQYFTVSRDDALPLTYSGKILVGLTTLGATRFSTPLSAAEILEAFTDVDIYVQHKAGLDIEHILILERLTGDG